MAIQLTEANEKINQLKAKIKELETVETKQETAVQETITSDVNALEAKFEARFKGLEELILKALQGPTPATVVAPATVVEVTDEANLQQTES